MDHYSFLNRFHAIDQETFDSLRKKLKSKQFQKGVHILEPGQIQKELYFIKGGVQMCCFDSERKTHILEFTYAPNLFAIPDSFWMRNPSRYYYTCLTDSEVDCLAVDEMEALLDESRQLERLFRKVAETLLSRMINRQIELRTMSIEERFTAFCQRSPHLLQMVPNKYIASYLEIDPTNFSKLFNSVKF